MKRVLIPANLGYVLGVEEKAQLAFFIAYLRALAVLKCFIRALLWSNSL